MHALLLTVWCSIARMYEIWGVPLHPMLVHFPAVLVPLFSVLLLLYVVIPPARRHLGWAVIVLAISVPAIVYIARLSGEQLRDYLLATKSSNKLEGLINTHAGYSEVLLWLTAVLLLLVLVFGALERARRSAKRRQDPATPISSGGADDDPATAPRRTVDPASRGRAIVMIVLGAVIIGLIAASNWYVFQAGHSGAAMVW